MYCNNCGTKIPDSSKFCSNCGYAVGKLINEVETEVDQPKVVKIFECNGQYISFSETIVKYNVNIPFTVRA